MSCRPTARVRSLEKIRMLVATGEAVHRFDSMAQILADHPFLFLHLVAGALSTVVAFRHLGWWVSGRGFINPGPSIVAALLVDASFVWNWFAWSAPGTR